MAPSRFGLQGAINRWVSLNASSTVPPPGDDVAIRHGDRGAAAVAAAAVAAAAPGGGGGGSSVIRRKTSYPRKTSSVASVASADRKAAGGSGIPSQHDDEEATTVCSSSTLGTKSLAVAAAGAQQKGAPASAGGVIIGPSSGTLAPGNLPGGTDPNRLPGGGPTGVAPAVADDDLSRASSKRRKRSTSSKSQLFFHQLSSGGGGGVSVASGQVPVQVQHGQQQQQHNYAYLDSGAQSVASAPAVSGGNGVGTARFHSGRSGSIPVGVPLSMAPPQGAAAAGATPASSVPPTAPGVYYGVDYSAQSRPPSRSACSVASNPISRADPSGGASVSARSEPGSVGGPPPTSLFHPLCPGAPPPLVPGGVVVTAHGLAPADPTAAMASASAVAGARIAGQMQRMTMTTMAAHNHASGAASLPGSVAGGVRGAGLGKTTAGTAAPFAAAAIRNRNRVRGIRSSAASVASVSSSVSGRRSRASAVRKPVVLEFRDWGAAPTAMAPYTATTMATATTNNHPTMMDISDPSPTPPPLLVSVPSDRAGQPPQVLQMHTSMSHLSHHTSGSTHHHHQTPPPTSSQYLRGVGPVGPPPTPPPMGGIPLRHNGQQPTFPPGVIHGDLPPPGKGMMQHIVHSATPSPGPSSSLVSVGVAGPTGAILRQQQQPQQPPTSMNNMADLEAKMEAALVLTCLGGASPAPPPASADAQYQGHPPAANTSTSNQAPQGQSDGVQRTSSESSDEVHPSGGTDAAPIYSSSDGYDGSGEEEGNKSPEPADDAYNPSAAAAAATATPTAAAPRRFLKGGKRGNGTGSGSGSGGGNSGAQHHPNRASSPWSHKSKNLADAALEQYQAAEATTSTTTSSGKSRFRTSLKRTNSKTRIKK